MDTATEILELWRSGLITTSEAIEALESLNIRGAFDTKGFTGYDYTNQQWITS